MFEKKAYAIQMSFEVPDSERRLAEKASECFESLLRKIKDTSKHLDFIYDPFKSLNNVDNEVLNEHRAAFREYRDEAAKNFNTIFRRGQRCLILMNEFSLDTKTEEMMNSFTDSLDEVKVQVNNFLSIFENLNSKDFSAELIATIDSVKKQLNQLRQLITDRILQHIDTNILAKNWKNNLLKDYQYKVEDKVPLVVELFRERNKALEGNGE